MSYRVFARKYRPRTFEEVVGQEHITRTLQNAIREDRLAQAYLLVGPRGIGKTSTARILAKALNCEEGPTPHPCGKCSACLEIAEGNNMDVVEIDGASNNGVDHIRDLRDNAQYSPVRGPYKIYLIDEVHMLTIGAFNALLKTLEEPPPHVKFIFATTEAHKVPATITSRCQRFDLRRIPDSLIAKHLLFIAGQEGVELEEEAADAIARGADGGLRDAESMFDQVISFCGKKITAKDVLDVFGFTSREVVQQLAGDILRTDINAALRIVEEQDDAGKDLSRLIEALVSQLRDLLIVQATGQGDASMQEVISLVSKEKMIELLEHFATTEGQLRWATDKRMQVDVSIIKGIHLIEQASLTEVIDTIASLRDGSPPPALPERKTAAAAAAATTRKPRVSPAPGEQPKAADSEPEPQPAKKTKKQSVPVKEVLVSKNEPESADKTKPESVDHGGARDAWKKVSERLSESSPVFFGWLTTGVFQVESGGRLIVEFPESQRACMEDEIWHDNLARIDKELSEECGHAVRFHAEFVPDGAVPESENSAAVSSERIEEAEGRAEDSCPQEESPERAEPEKTDVADPGADPMEEFKNDPLIQKALDIFEGELISSQKS